MAKLSTQLYPTLKPHGIRNLGTDHSESQFGPQIVINPNHLVRKSYIRTLPGFQEPSLLALKAPSSFNLMCDKVKV